jgi:hypothetical protein
VEPSVLARAHPKEGESGVPGLQKAVFERQRGFLRWLSSLKFTKFFWNIKNIKSDPCPNDSQVRRLGMQRKNASSDLEDRKVLFLLRDELSQMHISR